MSERLIPISDDGDSAKVHESLIKLVAKIAAAGPKMDVFCSGVSVDIIAGFDRYFNNEITVEELCRRFDVATTQLPSKKK